MIGARALALRTLPIVVISDRTHQIGLPRFA